MLVTDRTRNVVAEIRIDRIDGERYSGVVLRKNFPADLADALAEYAEVIEDQVLSLWDEAELRVAEFRLGVMETHDGEFLPIREFVVFPNQSVSFRLEKRKEGT
jgi:hypothetical protein